MDGLDTGILDNTTVQYYAENVLALPSPTIRAFSLYLIAQPRPWEVGRDFLNWARGRFGLQPTISARSTPQTVTFVLWPHAEGYLNQTKTAS